MKHKKIVPLLFFLVVGCVAPLAIYAESTKSYVIPELGISFQYPYSWGRTSKPFPSPDLIGHIFSPAGAPHAECAVLMVPQSISTSMSQDEVNKLTLTENPAMLQYSMSRKLNDTEVLTFSWKTFKSNPAYLAHVRYSSGPQTAKIYNLALILATSTPGRSWVASCTGEGKTSAEAESNFRFWQEDLVNIMESLK